MVLIGATCGCSAEAADIPSILENDPNYSPFSYIWKYIASDPGSQSNPAMPECYINEGYLNFKEDYYLNPPVKPSKSKGTVNVQEWPYALGDDESSPDITLNLLSGINGIPQAGVNTYVAVSAADCDSCSGNPSYLDTVLNTVPSANIHTDLSADTTHGKTIQCTNGSVYFTQNGSLNMQTVGETTKANNSLVFVETGNEDSVPRMYAYFKSLWHAVVNDTGAGFQGGTKDSSGLSGMTVPVDVGGRPVSFYAGRNNSFVGPTWTDGGMSIPFPNNLYPPTEGELPSDLNNVNWYDQILLDAGNQLVQGSSVNIAIYMFEIGEVNPFIDNLYRFIRYGFAPSKGSKTPVAISKLPGATVPSSLFPGRLTVNLYYQYQDRPKSPTSTSKYLNNPVKSGSPGRYKMAVKKVWQGFAAGRWCKGNPKTPYTPQDMHLKVATVTYGSTLNLYVTSSNLDMPANGSGKKWQAGNIIHTIQSDALYNIYAREFQSIQSDGIYSQRNLGFINARGNSYFDPGIAPADGKIAQPGIAAFVFPLNLNTGSQPESSGNCTIPK